MTLKRWYLGIAAGAVLGAAGLMFGSQAADATLFCITCGSDTTTDSFKFQGVASEQEPTGTGHDLPGTLCSGGGTCDETTWVAGNITSVTDSFLSQTLFQSGQNGGQQISFMIYGIGDISVTLNGDGTFTILNKGSTNGTQWAGADGKIHVDLYEYKGSLINFGSATGVKPGNRDGFGSINGVTHGLTGETLYASFDLIPGIDPLNSNVTLKQTADAATDPTTGKGNFYAQCDTTATPGGCSEFNNNGDPAGTGILAALFGSFTLNPPIGENALTTGCVTGPSECANGWDGSVNDPAITATAVPEPASLGLLGTGLALFGVAVGRRRRKGVSA